MFREFKVGELFDVHPTKAYKLNNSGLLSTAGSTPVVVNSSQNNGIGGYSELEPTEAPGILTFSDTTTGQNTLFYQSQPFIGYPHVQGMYPKNFKFNNLTALFMIATLRATLGKRKWDYSNKLNRAIVIETQIQLPVKPGTDEVNYTEDDIDWAFMESYIHELEESYIHELEESYIQELDAYLKETGLDDYMLTDDEREVLEREPVFKEFKVIDLFDVINTKSIRQSDVRDQLQSNNGSTPYITASDKNNAIFAYIDCPQEWIDEGNCIFIGGKTTTVTYQERDFCSNDSHNLALYLKNEEARTKGIQLSLAVILKKAFATKYQWSNALSKTKIKNESIQLPVKPGTADVNYTEADIDWDYMDAYVRVMEKQVIADVVDYKNEVISTTKALVKN